MNNIAIYGTMLFICAVLGFRMCRDLKANKFDNILLYFSLIILALGVFPLIDVTLFDGTITIVGRKHRPSLTHSGEDAATFLKWVVIPLSGLIFSYWFIRRLFTFRK